MSLTHIRALAEEYATKYNPHHVAPFPYARVVREHRDLKVYYTALDDNDVSGAILYKDGEYTILVNNNKPATRQHFTLAHEMGHYFLHQEALKQQAGIVDGDASLDSPNILYRTENTSDQKLEQEANNFAASLLMPADLVREGWRSVSDVEKLSQIFQVSVIAMSIRLTELGLVK